MFLLDAETAHGLSLGALSFINKIGMVNVLFPRSRKESSNGFILKNVHFKNRLGIAPGLDKNGDYIAALARLGVGHIELGTVTPRAQGGNTKPRLFRLTEHEAVINRMGFNNLGVANLVNNIKRYKNSKYYELNHPLHLSPVIGVNIGKNLDTSLDNAISDYIYCLNEAYEHADYLTANISSPNTENLRDLQQSNYLDNFLSQLVYAHREMANNTGIYKPLALKIAPDVSEQELHTICDLCCKHHVDILIISNTTISHNLLFDKNGDKIAGGLSGKPILERSNIVLQQAVDYLATIPNQSSDKDKLALIGVGGISSYQDAQSKLLIGSDLVQIYSGMVYQGPGLIKEILDNT